MRTPGPVDPSLRLVTTGADRGAGPAAGLKAGSFVLVEVRENLGGGLYRVAIGGRLVTASSTFPLEPGSRFKARVERSGEGLSLRLTPRESGAVAAREAVSSAALAGIPADPATRAAAAALLREGMAPEARALARVRRAVLRDAESGGEYGDLAAKMEAKLLPADEGPLAEILSLLEGRGEGAGGERRGEEKREREREGSAQAGRAPGAGEPGDLEGDFSLDLPEDEVPRRLAQLFRALAMRAGGGCDSLSLFNHLRGPECTWVIVPFRFDLDEVAFNGGFRIQLPYVRGGQGRFEAFFKASRGPLAEDWSFFVSFGGGRPPSLRIEMPKGSAAGIVARSQLDVLARSLAVHSCSVRSHERDDFPSGTFRAGFDLDA
jgi:hypothetical protein